MRGKGHSTLTACEGPGQACQPRAESRGGREEAQDQESFRRQVEVMARVREDALPFQEAEREGAVVFQRGPAQQDRPPAADGQAGAARAGRKPRVERGQIALRPREGLGAELWGEAQ